MADSIVDRFFLWVGLKDDLDGDLAKAENKITSGFANIASKAIAPLAAMFTTVAVGALLGEVAKEADEVGKLADSLGVSVEELHAWQEAAKLAGGSAQGLSGSVENLSKNLVETAIKGASSITPFLQQLGIDAKDGTGKVKDAFSVIEEIAQKIEGMDKQESLGILRGMGFDSGTIKLIQTGSMSIKEAIRLQKEIGVYTAETAEAAAEYNEATTNLGRTFKMLFVPIITVVLQGLTKMMDAWAKGLRLVREHSAAFVPVILLLAGVLAKLLFPAFLKLIGLGPLLTGASGLITGVLSGTIKLSTALKYATGVVKAFTASFLANPIVWAVAALLLLGAAIDDLIVWMEGGESAFESFWIKLFGSAENAQKIFDDIKRDFMAIWDATIPMMKTAGDLFGRFALVVADLAQGPLGMLLAIIVLIIRTIGLLLAIILALIDGTDESINNMLEKWEGFKDGVLGYIDSIKAALGKLWEYGGKIFDGIGKAASFIFGGGGGNNSLAVQGAGKGTGDFRQIENTVTQNVTIQTKDDPDAIASAVGGATQKAVKDITGPSNNGSTG